MPTLPNALPLLDWPPGALKLVRILSVLPARTVFTGRCVRAALQGPVPDDLEILTEASPEQVLERLPHSVAVAPRTAMVPVGGARVDVHSLATGSDLETALATRDLSVNAIAIDPLSKELIDPFGGHEDLALRRLRPTRIGLYDPLSALRACGLVASEGFEPTPAWIAAARAAAPGITQVTRARVRPELERLLLGSEVEAGLSLLHTCGLLELLAPGADPEAARWVALLPEDPLLRLTAWLHGTRTIRILRRLRYPPRWVDYVELLLRHHPVERHASGYPARRRLARRSDTLCEDLIELRRAEIAATGEDLGAQRLLDETRSAIAAVRDAERRAEERPRLALDGRAVMAYLACQPGPQVGRALAHLEREVAADPGLNNVESLHGLLDRWKDA